MKRFRILADAFRHTMDRYGSIAKAITGIVNRRIDKGLAQRVAVS
jgi:hypothetical protein